MRDKEFVNEFLLNFDQETMTTAEQILAVTRLVERVRTDERQLQRQAAAIVAD